MVHVMIKIRMMVSYLGFDSGSLIKFVILHNVFSSERILNVFIYKLEIMIVTTSNVVMRIKITHTKHGAHSSCSVNLRPIVVRGDPSKGGHESVSL